MLAAALDFEATALAFFTWLLIPLRLLQRATKPERDPDVLLSRQLIS